MNYYTTVLKKYAVFSGRATRAEYWYFVLINFIISLLLQGLAAIVGPESSAAGVLALLSGVYAVALLLPGIAVAVRRLHDTNRSGGYVFLTLIPFVGAIILLVFLAQDSQSGTNQYGPNPKEPVATV